MLIGTLGESTTFSFFTSFRTSTMRRIYALMEDHPTRAKITWTRRKPRQSARAVHLLALDNRECDRVPYTTVHVMEITVCAFLVCLKADPIQFRHQGISHFLPGLSRQMPRPGEREQRVGALGQTWWYLDRGQAKEVHRTTK